MQKYSGVGNTGMRILDPFKAKEMKDITISVQASQVSIDKITIFSEDSPMMIYCPSSQLQATTVLIRDAKAETIC